MKNYYTTARGYIKAKLLELGYPVEISKFFANSMIRNAGRYIVKKEGIRIERQYYPRYNDSIVWIYTNGYLTKESMKEILNEIKQEHPGYDYNTSIYVY